MNLVSHGEYPTNYGQKVTTGQRAFRQRILQPQGWHPNREGTVQLLASWRQRARVNSIGEHMQILLSAVISGERKMLGAPLQRVR